MDPIFEAKIKQAFSRVKEDINSLKVELREYKALLQQLVDKLSFESSNPEKNNIDDKNVSIGNEGVYSFTHSLIHSPFTHLCTHSDTNLPNYSQKSPKQTLTFQDLPTQNTQIITQNEVSHPLQTLTNKEFLVFLTIYQLEKELPRVTYEHIARKLTLTSGCIRSYITSIIRKKAPIIKSKLNNKIVLLSIDPSFRSLTSEQKLINLYYQKDPLQSTLFN